MRSSFARTNRSAGTTRASKFVSSRRPVTGSRRSTPSCNDAVSATCSDPNAAGSVVAGSGLPRMMAVARGAKASVVTAKFAASAGSPKSMRPSKRPGTSANSKRPSAALATPDAPSYVTRPSVPASSAPASGKGSPPSQPRNSSADPAYCLATVSMRPCPFNARWVVLVPKMPPSFRSKGNAWPGSMSSALSAMPVNCACDPEARSRYSTEPRSSPSAPMRQRGCSAAGSAAPGTGSPPSFDQFAVPSGFTTSRTVASETEIVSTSETLKMSDQGMRRRSWPTETKGSSPNPGGCAIASPLILTEGEGKNRSPSDSTVAGSPAASSIQPATIPRASGVPATIHRTAKAASATSAMAAGMRAWRRSKGTHDSISAVADDDLAGKRLDLHPRAAAALGEVELAAGRVLAGVARLRSEAVLDVAAEGLDVEVGVHRRLDPERDRAAHRPHLDPRGGRELGLDDDLAGHRTHLQLSGRRDGGVDLPAHDLATIAAAHDRDDGAAAHVLGRHGRLSAVARHDDFARDGRCLHGRVERLRADLAAHGLEALLAASPRHADVGAHGVDDETRAFRHAQRQVGVFVMVAAVVALLAIDLDAHVAVRGLELELVPGALELGDELALVLVPGRDRDAALHVRHLDRRVGRDVRALRDLLLRHRGEGRRGQGGSREPGVPGGHLRFSSCGRHPR